MFDKRLCHTRAVADGARSAPETEVDLKRVPKLMPEEVAKKAGVKLDQEAPIAEPDEMANYDGVIFGTPTRYSNMAAQMRNFLDQTGSLWTSNALVGKVGSAFTSTASQHGGQETTLVSTHFTLLHLGFVIVDVPYTSMELSKLEPVSGGTPYGAATIGGEDGSRWPTEDELATALSRQARRNDRRQTGARVRQRARRVRPARNAWVRHAVDGESANGCPAGTNLVLDDWSH
jgi:NAD(P)H dehydrogenase (quinone)